VVRGGKLDRGTDEILRNLITTTLDIRQVVTDDHRQILALFHLYLDSPSDSRQAIVEQILRRLTSHLEMEEEFLFEKIRKLGPQSRKLIGDAEMEHEEIKAMIHDVQQSETDDDQALDEFFEDMMQTVRAHFVTKERDLFPLVESSLDTSPF
jgi:hemerythrin superfamily protein